MNNTHAAIRRLLERYRAEQGDYLHEGRNAPQPDIEAYARRFEAILAAEMHEATPGTETEIEVQVVEWDDRTILTAGHYELVIMLDTGEPIRFSGVSIRTMTHLITCQALLQRARALMTGGA